MPTLDDKLARNLDKLVSLAEADTGEAAPKTLKSEVQDLGGSAMIEDESVESDSDPSRLDHDAGEKTPDLDRGNDTETPIGAGLPHPLGGTDAQ